MSKTKQLEATISKIFFAPTLGISREKLEKNNYLNAYIADKKKEVNYEDCCLLLFKPDKIEVFKEFLDGEYERTLSIIDDYDYEGGYIVLVYTLDDYFKKDFDLIRHGRYSKCSDEFKELFPKVVKVIRNGIIKEELSIQHRIFDKTEDLQKYWEDRIGVDFKDEYECWDGFNEQHESLDIDEIKKLI